MALFVLKNNPAFRTFYQRHGFGVVRETPAELVMRRTIGQSAQSCLSKRLSPHSKGDRMVLPLFGGLPSEGHFSTQA
jgi:hypothetical protein